MRPSERAANLRRARRRTLFAPTVGAPAGPDPEPEIAPVAAEATPQAALQIVEPVAITDFALDEFVIDDDDYPEVSIAQRRVAPAASAPDRVDDIDDWLEEFAVSDGLDAMPH